MNMQDVLAKFKLMMERLAKELTRSLVKVHEKWSQARLVLGPKYAQQRQKFKEAMQSIGGKIQFMLGQRLAAQLATILAALQKIVAEIKRLDLPKLIHGREKILAVAGGALALGLLLWAVWPGPDNPYLAFEEASRALSEARQAQAKIYTPKLLQAAEARWERARLSWHYENQRWRFRRDYDDVIESVNVATQMAKQASTRAVAIRDSLQWLSATGITLVKDKIDSFKAHFDHLPVQAALRKKFLSGELAILESELAFNRRDYFRATVKYQQAAAEVGSAGEQASKTMRAYLANMPRWRNWAAETIAWSKQENEIAIVVDKMAASVQVYKAGILQAEYPVELGPRWVGHKRHRGDGATPEGRYHVLRKKEGKHTIYHKALEINYPNDSDKEAFQSALARGELPRGTHIGGLIEIHGEGGKGANWTAGCVALRNVHMEAVFKLAKVGTPVTIVGSLKGLPVMDLNMGDMATSTNGVTSRKKS